ncbi:MAG TPA: tripartite tricarboxylate transporter substrate-binding protein [Burkholderiales bacterium]|jgi:tripartite-type tricarboxylate transporter receptor subunit TctC|nr:tripartite tricarboxylate transporter substrate-binding protein [Burkholderiales bacterium]
MNRILSWVPVATLLALSCSSATAQSQRPLRVLVASAPAGPSDVQARLLVPKMSEALGQSLIVDNRASNNGVVATELCAKAAADGNTVCVGNSGTHAVNATLYQKLPYNVVRDFDAISQFSTTGMVVAANSKLPGTNLQDLVAYAKNHPGKTNIAIPGATGQLAGDALWSMLQIQMNNVHYKGSAPSEMAVVAGESQISLLTPLATMNHIASGRIKAYGITSAQRHPLLPNVPTIAEQGVQGYDFQFWNGLFVPKKTPDRIVRQLYKAVLHALETPDVRDRYTQLGLVVVGNTPEEFAQVVKTDVDKFRKVILESGIPRL